ncbi:DUF929 domain-containing protein [Acidiferrimicrobium sp. IK]|uniref:DUF929 domain-containing protein n=1 Tax=Acidiferrimicrobium sp. IK TaxID=2871700 RepID=UPI0021CB2C38|nr:DUF929 domain-containing protein [Acidiferrimicrobium sp. IK]MCU4182970.1 DUF929 domain-containing protein [Acidiferrimicrobium sp. IK]
MATSVPPRPGGGNKPPPRPGKQPNKGKQANFRASKRRQQRYLAMAAVVVVVAVVAVIVGVKAGGGGSNSGLDKRSAISTAALDQVMGVTPAEMATAAEHRKLGAYPFAVTSSALTSAGKPEVLYIGAEYCPYCAGERWALAMALNQFGTFTGLRSVTSTPNDSVASVPTFTFYQSTYSSPYIVFKPVEQQTVSGKTLETPTKAETAILTKFDGPPYTQSGGIPFLDIGGKWIQDGINFVNSTMSHQSFDAIASQLPNGGTTPIGADIDATAGVLVSDICALTGGQSLHDNAACKAFPSVITKAPASAS